MAKKEITGSLDEMVTWMKSVGWEEEKINKFSEAVGQQSRGIAPNCRRYVSGWCGDNDQCLEYTIECCSKDENGHEICSSTSTCRC